MQDLPQTRSDALMAARTGHLTVLRELAPYIWPAGRPDLRMRVVMALVALIIAKAITLMVPIAYKAVVDLLTDEATGKQITAIGLAASPVFLIVAYGVGRVLMVLFAQFRDVWFTAVAQHAVRELANRTFRHLHELSLRFHLERRTGGLNRVIERGVTGVDTIVRMAVLNSIPTAVELLMISGLVAYYFGWIYVVVVLLTVGLYVAFTFWASERRIAIRRDMNEFRHRGPRQGGGQPAQLRDGEIFRQRGARGAPLRFLHGALREGRRSGPTPRSACSIPGRR